MGYKPFCDICDKKIAEEEVVREFKVKEKDFQMVILVTQKGSNVIVCKSCMKELLTTWLQA